MSGFCGYKNFNKKINNNLVITEMLNALKKKVPAKQDITIENDSAIGFSSPNILDKKLENTVTKKQINDNTYYIVYTGKIYNINILRDTLITKGYKFENKSESLVLITAFAEYGTKMLNYLNGIFSFCIYNSNDNSFFLARDRLGIKLLYYFYDVSSSLFAFSTEIKGLLNHNDITAIMDKEGLMELIGLRSCS